MAGASFVWETGAKEVCVPSMMGTPCADQLTGTPAEKVYELAARVCYDSLGYDHNGKRKGRSTRETLDNVYTSGHWSVYEHVPATFALRTRYDNGVPPWFRNRAGVFVYEDTCSPRSFQYHWIVTANLRALLDAATGKTDDQWGIGKALLAAWHEYVSPVPEALLSPMQYTYDIRPVYGNEHSREAWITMHLHGSRAWSHEQVRHKFDAAVSQRSTRYCDETETPFYGVSETIAGQLRIEYARVVAFETAKAKMRGLVGREARKHARGVARAVLPHGLQTQMIYSASVQQWRNIFMQRGGLHADKEIRDVVVAAYDEIQEHSRFKGFFDDFVWLTDPVHGDTITLKGA